MKATMYRPTHPEVEITGARVLTNNEARSIFSKGGNLIVSNDAYWLDGGKESVHNMAVSALGLIYKEDTDGVKLGIRPVLEMKGIEDADFGSRLVINGAQFTVIGKNLALSDYTVDSVPYNRLTPAINEWFDGFAPENERTAGGEER